MEFALGFIIAVFIALTGVGAGSMTTPLLILLLGMPTRASGRHGADFWGGGKDPDRADVHRAEAGELASVSAS